MAEVQAGSIVLNYERQGSGEPLVLIPYLAADHACYAFQVADYAKHFTCISIDLRGTGESEDQARAYTTQDLADDVAALMQAIGIDKAHVQKPDYIEALSDFVRGRPAQRVDAFIRQSDAVIAHDVEAQLARIVAPTQITFGRHDAITSTRFAERLTNGIAHSQLHVFDDCSHAPIYENVAVFNATTLAFLRGNAD